MSNASPARRRFRPEIEGLRSVAFVLVAIFHVWFDRVSGGVDVFFTVAGFLITLSLLGHVERFGSVRIGLYFSRLATRLLPAAAVVLVAVAVGILVLLPFPDWQDRFTQVLASALYWENWFLAFNSVEYLTTDQSRSPLQHFWAMSIQGQFYIIWLALFLIAVWLVSRMPRVGVRRALLVGVLGLMTISFVWSIIETSTNQQFAYFSTFTRVWEFGFGSLLALLIDRLRIHAGLASIISWIGLGALLSIGLLLPVADLFPGYVALVPVLSACVIIIAGQSDASWGANRLLGSKPFVWLGKLGYSFYLWHWPVLIFVLHVQGRTEAGPRTGAVILAFSLLLSYLTYRFVEQPVMQLRGSERPRAGKAAVALAACGAIVASVAGGTGLIITDRHVAANQAALEEVQGDDCFGAGAIDPAQDCGDLLPSDAVVPLIPSEDSAAIFEDDCLSGWNDASFKPCTWGDPDSETRIALIGNSHAAVWFPPYLELAETYGWRLDTFFKGSCSYNAASRDEKQDIIRSTCDEWKDKLTAHLAENEPYDYILTSALAQNTNFIDPDTGEVTAQAGVDGYLEVWQPLVDRGTTILAFRDYPRMSEEVLECAIADPTADCSRPLEDAQVPLERETIAQAASLMDGVKLIDMTHWFCTDGMCPAVIGNVQVYRDPGHFTATYGETLSGPLIRELQLQAGFPPIPEK